MKKTKVWIRESKNDGTHLKINNKYGTYPNKNNKYGTDAKIKK